MAERRTPRTPSASEGSGSRGYSPAQERHRRDSGEWRPAFLAALRNSANVRASCQAAGIHRSIAYDRREADPAFAAAWKDALDDALDMLEAAAFRRAATSSDNLLIFLLKAHRPELYRERVDMRLEVSQVLERLVPDPDERAAVLAEVDRILKGAG